MKSSRKLIDNIWGTKDLDNLSEFKIPLNAVENMMEEYAQQRVNEVLDKAAEEVDKLTVDSPHALYENGYESAKYDLEDLILKLKNNEK